MSKTTSGQRVIEGKKGAVAHGKKGKEKASAKPTAVVVAIGIGKQLGDAILNMHKGEGIQVILRRLAGESVETQKQAMAELWDHQYTAQAAVRGIVWEKGMKPEAFMGKGATTIYKKQKSLAANYSRTRRILKAIIEKRNVARILECTCLSDMAAYADKSGTKSAADPKKPMSDTRFELFDAQTERLIQETKAGDTVKVNLTKFEAHLMHCLKLADQYSMHLSAEVKALLKIEGSKHKGRTLKVVNG